jgi:lipid-A-disaccharide synthase
MAYKVMIVTGEASGDLHGAGVAAALKELQPDIYLYGVGGQAMASAGVNIIYDIKELSVMGFVEVVKKYPHIKGVFDKLVSVLKAEPPDVLVTIDYADFNMRLAKAAKGLGIKVVYYIAPSAWAWRRGRAKLIAESVERVAAIFPFEVEVYEEAGAQVSFVGHPLLDIVKPSMPREQAFHFFAADATRPIITLMPGSRQQEIEQLLPEMLRALELIQTSHPGIQSFLPLAPTISRARVEEICGRHRIDIKIIERNTYDLMGISTFIIAKSGTTTLEAALMGAPAIIMYKLAPVTWLLGKLLVKIPYFGLPNIVAGKGILPELLQYDVQAEKIAALAEEWLNDAEKLTKVREELRAMQKKLGETGAVKRVAQVILDVATMVRG